MSIWGTVTDHLTGRPLRDASAADWRETADALAAGTPEGVFTDENGVVVWVDGGPGADITEGDIRELRDEAAARGDLGQVRLCDAALTDDDAFAECARVILDARVESFLEARA